MCTFPIPPDHLTHSLTLSLICIPKGGLLIFHDRWFDNIAVSSTCKPSDFYRDLIQLKRPVLSLTHLLTHLLTHSLTHLLTHSLTYFRYLNIFCRISCCNHTLTPIKRTCNSCAAINGVTGKTTNKVTSWSPVRK